MTNVGEPLETTPAASKAERASYVFSLSLAVLIIFGFLFMLIHGWLTRPQPVEVISLNRTIEMKVAVRGAVRSPGVFTLQDGDRVEDAIKAAGGLAEGAIITSFNPAARVRDQDEIYVLSAGEATRVPTATSTAAPSGVSTVGPSKAAQGTKFDLNAVTAAQLETVPGIAELTASRIVESRDRVGPFKKIEELRDRGIMNQQNFDRAKDYFVIQ